MVELAGGVEGHDTDRIQRLAPLRVLRIERVRLHADLTILAKLACRLASERAFGSGVG